MFSFGPTITPERACRTRPGKAASKTRSHAAFNGPYSRSSESNTSESSSTGSSGQPRYADPDETKP
jgi:hypothetical protein